MDAKEFLSQIKKLDCLIENKRDEMRRLRELVDNISPSFGGERVKSTHNPGRFAEAIGKYIDIENELERCTAALVETKRRVLAVIEQLCADEYDVLYQIYAKHMSYKEVAYKCNRSVPWVTVTHKRAIESVQHILDAASI